MHVVKYLFCNLILIFKIIANIDFIQNLLIYCLKSKVEHYCA